MKYIEQKYAASPIVLVVFWGFVFLPFLTNAASQNERPNILVLLCDDLGYGDLGCYGNPVIRTPSLDRLAAEGIRFTDFYATAPVCSASRAGLLTGRTPSRVGVYDWIPDGDAMHLPKSEKTFAAVLRAAGYDTALSGKWHCNGRFNKPVEQPQPNDHGFDHWFATQNNAEPSHANPNNFVRNGIAVGPLQGYACRLVVDEAIVWLKARKSFDRPFCLLVSFHEPHEPIASPEELVEKYRRAGTEPRNRAEYYANVENMDHEVGRLVDYLKRNELWNNTLTFFTSDNGPETLDRYPGSRRSYGTSGDLRGMKLWLYEGGCRVPGIVVWPKAIAPGQVSDMPVGAIDFFPTFRAAAAAKISADHKLDGIDLGPIFRGKKPSRTKPLFWYYLNALGEPRVAIRDGDWKLVATLEGNPGKPGIYRAGTYAGIKTTKFDRFELYNLVEDRREQVDLAHREPRRLEIMKQKMSELFRDVQNEAPLWK